MVLLEVDFTEGVVRCEDSREVWVRHYPLPIDYEATRGVARRPRVREFEDRGTKHLPTSSRMIGPQSGR